MPPAELRRAHRTILAAAALATLAALAAPLSSCRPDAGPAPAASAAASSPAPAPAHPTPPSDAPDAAPAVTHEPGTVPPPPASRPAAPKADAGPPPLPVISRLPAAKSHKQPTSGWFHAGFAGKGAFVAVTSGAAFDLVDPDTGAGWAIAGPRVGEYELSPDDSLLALAESGRVTLWDLGKGALRHTWNGEAGSLRFSPDGKRLAMVVDGAVSVRDTTSGAEIMRVKPDTAPFDLVFGAGGKELVTSTNNVEVDVYSVESGAKLPGGGGAQTGGTFGIALSPDGRWAAAGAPDGHGLQVFEVHAWGPRTLVEVTSCQEHVGPVFSTSGRFVYAHGGSRWVKGFEVGSFKPYASYHAPPGRAVESAAADLSRVVVTGGGKGVVVVTVGNGTETPLERPLDDEASYTLSADGAHVGGGSKAAARVWSAKTGRVTYEEAP